MVFNEGIIEGFLHHAQEFLWSYVRMAKLWRRKWEDEIKKRQEVQNNANSESD